MVSDVERNDVQPILAVAVGAVTWDFFVESAPELYSKN